MTRVAGDDMLCGPVTFDSLLDAGRRPLVARQSVLVVDPLEETHEVLRAALAGQGVEVVAARNAAQGLALARRCLPNLIVLDLESDGSPAVVSGKLLAESSARSTPVLFLGTAQRHAPRRAGCEFFAKPYHYAPLLRKIEALLEESQVTARRPAAKAA